MSGEKKMVGEMVNVWGAEKAASCVVAPARKKRHLGRMEIVEVVEGALSCANAVDNGKINIIWKIQVFF